jgi:hypothetical protein
MSGCKGSQASGPVSYETIRTIGLQFPHVRETTLCGKPALKIRNKMFASVPGYQSAEPDSLVIRVDFDQRGGLLAADPRFTTSRITKRAILQCWPAWRACNVAYSRICFARRTGWKWCFSVEINDPTTYQFVTGEAASDSNKKHRYLRIDASCGTRAVS